MEGRYFATTKKGEVAEWKSELRSMDKDKRKDAVKKVIAAMTVGKVRHVDVDSAPEDGGTYKRDRGTRIRRHARPLRRETQRDRWWKQGQC